jgi:transforming growth factor-beta-induced protein
MPGTETKAALTPLPPQPTRDIKATLEAQGEFSEVLKSARVAGVHDLMDNPGPFTIFAPTDKAFRALEPGVLARLTAAPDKLKEVLLYHGLAEKLPVAKAAKQGSAKSVLGPDVRFRAEGGRVFVNDAQIIRSDIQCTNGVLHAIDKVLFPPGFKLPEAARASKKPAEKPGQKTP